MSEGTGREDIFKRWHFLPAVVTEPIRMLVIIVTSDGIGADWAVHSATSQKVILSRHSVSEISEPTLLITKEYEE